MSSKSRFLFFIAMAVILPVLCYIIAFGSILLFPLSEQNSLTQAFFVLFLIIGLLIVPYWILKFVLRSAHEVNPEEKELELKDLSQDHAQLKHSKRS